MVCFFEEPQWKKIHISPSSVTVFWSSAMSYFLITNLIMIIVEILSADALFCTVLRQTDIVILKLASSGEVGAHTLLPLGFLKAMC